MKACAKMDEAEAAFLEAIGIYRNLKDSGNSMIEDSLRDTMNRLKELYEAMGRCKDAQQM